MARLIVKNGFKTHPIVWREETTRRRKILLREEIASPLNFLTFFLPRFSPSRVNYLFILQGEDKWKLRTPAKLRAVRPALLSCMEALPALEGLPGVRYPESQTKASQAAGERIAWHWPSKEYSLPPPSLSYRNGKRGERWKEQSS